MAGMFRDVLRLQQDILRMPRDLLAGVAGRSWVSKQARCAPAERPVVTLPGFGATASSHRRLNGFLQECGYESTTFQPGFPRGESFREFTRKLDKTLGRLVKQLADRHGAGVSLVGQSAGGLFCREFAGLYPQDVDRVITLGAPTVDPSLGHLQNRLMELMVKRMTGAPEFQDNEGPEGLLHWSHGTPPLPYVAICSPVDGAVHEQTALVPAVVISQSTRDAPRENIRIRCSHFGMHYNPFVLVAMADRLAQSRDNWQPFNPRHYLPRCPQRFLHRIFPEPEIAQVSGMPNGTQLR